MFWEFNSERGPDLGSVWLVLSQVRPHRPITRRHRQPLVVGALRAVVRGGRGRSGFRAPTTPRLAQLGFLVVAGFLLVNKVYSPQYVLWLLPLAVLARPRWRDQLIWQACEVVYFASVWWYLGGDLQPGERRRTSASTGSRSWSGWPASSTWWHGGARRAVPGHDPVRSGVHPGRRIDQISAIAPTRSRLTRETGPISAVALDRPGAAAQPIVDAVERRRGVAHPHVDVVADLGHLRVTGQEQHRGLHVRRLGEEPLLAVDPERRAGAARPRPGRRGPRSRRATCSPASPMRRLEADAVRGAAADDEQVAVAGRCAAAVAEPVAALDLVHVEHGRGDAQRLAVAEPQVGADPRAGPSRSAYDVRSVSSSAAVRWLTQTVVGRAARRRRRRSAAARPRRGGRAGGQRQVQRDALEPPAAPAAWPSVPQLRCASCRGAACASRARARTARRAGASSRPARSSGRLTVWITRRASAGSGAGLERPPRREHEQVAVVARWRPRAAPRRCRRRACRRPASHWALRASRPRVKP